MNKTIKRELEVAFSKRSQPVWFRIAKWVLIGLILYLFWGHPLLWPIFGVLLVLALGLHFWYRHKTRGWTKSYGMWQYHDSTSSPGQE